MHFPPLLPMTCPLFLILLLLLLLSSSPADSTAGNILKLKLHRRPELAGPTRLDLLRSMYHGDRHRQRMIAGQISRRRSACAVSQAPAGEEAMEMPVWSGAYTGTGQYFVRVRLGTPAQPFLLIPDTGSDLTWVTCRYRRGVDSGAGGGDAGAGGSGRRRKGRVFKADLSRTFRPINCSSELCRTELPFSLTACPTATSPCNYDYVYGDGSSAQGFFANESATVQLLDHRRTKLKGLVVGCTSTAVGSSFASSDGILALGHGPNTFVSRAGSHFGHRFSYCLVDHLSPRNATGYLAFGPNPDLKPRSRSSAPLILDPTLDPFYYVAVAGISIAGKLLPIPSTVWNESAGGGAIIDSGTTLTVLSEPAYAAAVAALSRGLAAVPRLVIDPFEYCYNWTSPAASKAVVPEFELRFVGTGRLSPPEKSYLIDVAPGVKCIGLASTPWPGVSTIGNIMQQEHIWEFDLENRRLRFRRSNCTAGTYYHR